MEKSIFGVEWSLCSFDFLKHKSFTICIFSVCRTEYERYSLEMFSRKTRSHLSMVLETASSFASSQIPQAQCFVPWTRQSVVTIRRQNNVADEVRVTVQSFLWNTVVGFVASQFPYDQCLIWKYNTCIYMSKRRTSHFGIKFVKNIQKFYRGLS